jgi:hemerythrin-like domain-containing protein
MCEHCGCRGVEPIAALMDEHFALRATAARVRNRLARDDRSGAAVELIRLRDDLEPHVWKEERGLFAAMREAGDFVEHVDELEDEHLAIDDAIEALDPADPTWPQQVVRLLDLLEDHIDKENLGLFPAAVVSLGARGWQTVSAAAAATATAQDVGPTGKGLAALLPRAHSADSGVDEEVTF